MPAKKINTLLDFWAASLLLLGSTPLFANHKDLYHVIDCTSVGAVQWENFKIQHKCNVQHAPDEQNEKDEQGKLIELEDGQDREDGLEALDDQIIHGNPSMVGATLVPIILGSDKTTVSIVTGQTDYYLLYLSIGNVHNTTCHAHHDAVVLITFLAMPKSTRKHASTQMFCRFKKSHIVDYEEQALLLCIVCNWCPKCLAHWEDLDQGALQCFCEHTELAMKELDLQLLWVVYGIDGDVTLFTSMFPHVDIHKMFLPDILHQLIKGGFKDHLVDWVERYLIQMHGKSAAEKVLDEIDKRIAAVAPFAWTGNDSKGLMKVYIAAIKGFVPRDVICTFHAFLEFCYLTLTMINNALDCFHLYHEVFWNAEVVMTFSLPQQHTMKHYPYLICQFGVPNGLCSSITESKHIKAVKRPYWHTNHFQALGQMLLINQRLDKLAAACVDFQDHGINKTNNHHNEAGHPHDASSNQSSGIDTDKPTASYEEEGNTDDSPMSVKAHIRDVPLDECPLYDGPIHVYNSACSMFYAPSDMSGIHSMHCEYIYFCPEWRNTGPCYDCVYVVTDPCAEGMLGLDVAHADYPCAIIHWFDHVGDVPDADTGMWIVCVCNPKNIAIIHIDTIYHTAQLIPIYAAHHINPGSVKPHESYDKYQHFYVNKFADHHAFKIAS
ncbi:hypothetical protein EDC04DRAFT_2869494 [Pisolithus marmoratus]|nr:hypothetical protein EDC04DRAFT_2869494 [Pisolithus marmoratus]